MNNNGEINALLSSKSILEEQVKILKSTYSDINFLLEGLDPFKDKFVVEWAGIDKDNEILLQTADTLDDFIKSKKQEYMDKTKKEKEDCDREFQTYISTYKCSEIEFILNKYSDNPTIFYILENQMIFSYDTIKMKLLINEIKLPKYKRIISSSTLANGQRKIDLLLRGLHFQRLYLEEQQKRLILEEKIKILSQMLKDNVRDDFDFSNVNNAFDILENTFKDEERTRK